MGLFHLWGWIESQTCTLNYFSEVIPALAVRTLSSSCCQSLCGSLAQHRWHHLAVLPGHQMIIVPSSQFQSSRWTTKLPWWWTSRDLACSLYTAEMQNEGLSNVFMCSEDGKTWDLMKATDCCPIPSGSHACIHSNKLNKAGPGYRHWDSGVHAFFIVNENLGTVLAGDSHHCPKQSPTCGFSRGGWKKQALRVWTPCLKG